MTRDEVKATLVSVPEEGHPNLGFVMNKGIRPDIDKVEVIRAMSDPTTVKQVRLFICAIGYLL